MGCTSSVYAVGKKKKKIIPEVSVFVPFLRVPVQSDMQRTLRGLIPKDLADRITSLRNQIVLIAENTGGSAISELTKALEQYLCLVIGLTKKEYGLQDLVEFRWKELEDGRQEQVAFLYAGECSRGISHQALAQGTEIQLGLAVQSQNATLSVKRRLACEQLTFFTQAYFCLSEADNGAAAKKQLLFLKWKHLEAKAASYYYHGLILDKGTEPSSHVSAVCCFLAAEELLAESKKACLTFCLADPITRASPPWGAMKHLHNKIPETATKKSQMYGYLLDQEKGLQILPDLPEFELSLKPDDYELPELDPAWDCGKWEIAEQTLKEHLSDGGGEQQT
ncbi:hypothetical protein DH2020_009596 [Rehmannia glutinosa]|uniref:BRO1 domain-containing protein n=1 Tax=Rehmannia glutinosa TaxID=99300 RepID=A0ABR0X6S5_REHGL